MDAPIKVRNLIVIVEALIDVLARETALLKGMRVREITGLQGDKQRLSQAYAENHQLLSKDPAPLQQMSKTERQGLGELLGALQQIVAENARAIEAAKAAGERVLRLLIELGQGPTQHQDRLHAHGCGRLQQRAAARPGAGRLDRAQRQFLKDFTQRG